MRAGELFRAVKKDAEAIRLLTRLCEDPASVGKLLVPELRDLVCRCVMRCFDITKSKQRCLYAPTPKRQKAENDAYDNLADACALYRKWAK